ncbi:type II toxin-antitoxin system VapC family toxin [Microbacterium luticocti]|uniref:type II toxin-antitoxin system VapC family toxin n=1 Tax=Microbacterium luticocti TaxID=451764 RepID=UPI0003F52F43|nr:type II toxin-antitoxin system VapC family toxin [Microbacterium luticocti]
MSWLIDTNVVSEATRRRPNARVRRWLQEQEPLASYVSVITVFEIELGVARKERSDPAQGQMLRRWAEQVIGRDFRGRVLPVEAAVASIAARMHIPDPRPERDALIAATALHHNLTVVTRNVRDFAPLGVRVFDPWSG